MQHMNIGSSFKCTPSKVPKEACDHPCKKCSTVTCINFLDKPRMEIIALGIDLVISSKGDPSMEQK